MIVLIKHIKHIKQTLTSTACLRYGDREISTASITV